MGMPNTTLKAARVQRRMSQDDLARAIRDAGRRIGEPNACSKKAVQRWESGAVSTPRGHIPAGAGIRDGGACGQPRLR